MPDRAPPLSATNAPPTRGIYLVSLPIVIPAGKIRQIPGKTKFLSILSATNLDVLSISFDGNNFNPFPRGFTLTDFEADSVWIRNDGGSTNTVRIATGFSTLRDNRFETSVGSNVPVDIEQVGGAAIALGQNVMAASLPVVIASNQTALPVTFTPSGTQDVNLTKVGGTAVTLGQKTMAASIPVVLASDEARLPVEASAALGNLANGIGTAITAGGVSQACLASNAGRRYLFVQNNSAGPLWIDFGTAAVLAPPAIQLAPGASFVFEASWCSSQQVNIIGATTGQAYTAREG